MGGGDGSDEEGIEEWWLINNGNCMYKNLKENLKMKDIYSKGFKSFTWNEIVLGRVPSQKKMQEQVSFEEKFAEKKMKESAKFKVFERN